ncbi:MAG: diadenosine tetraphosphate hydrolase [Planctomycetes bacterium]|nr:diadenosine tetraphosphate hydrolase [Planctomycetota bacterium]
MHVSLEGGGHVAVQKDHDGAHWRLRPHPAPSPVAGWCVIDLVRPAASLDLLTARESQELGLILASVSAAVRVATRCERAYVTCFAEAHRQVHLHVAPRHESDPRTQGWTIADLYRKVQSGETAPAAQEAHEKTFAEIAKVLNGLRLT